VDCGDEMSWIVLLFSAVRLRVFGESTSGELGQ
jgi:hypothetical protein